MSNFPHLSAAMRDHLYPSDENLAREEERENLIAEILELNAAIEAVMNEARAKLLALMVHKYEIKNAPVVDGQFCTIDEMVDCFCIPEWKSYDPAFVAKVEKWAED
jgi:hypothetical protein